MSQYVDDALSAIDKFVALNRTQMSDLSEEINRKNKEANQLAVFLFVLGGLVLLGAVIAIFKSVVRPLDSVAEAISRYSAGETSARVTSKGFVEIQTIGSNFNSMAQSLEEKQQDQLRFIASIAHDLRNPISSMSMASELLIRESEEKEPGVAQIIFRQAKHLDRLVGDLLDTARIEAGQMEIEFSLQDVSSSISDAVELHQMDSGVHKLSIEMPKGPLVCNCDRGRLSQVMNNLISNAIKYSPNGGTVTVKAWEEKTRIVFSVTDQGIGVSQDDLNNIFKPFHRSKATKGTIPGVGLGLSASRRIVELHGGELKVESTLGKGSTFYVVLPTQARSGLSDLSSGGGALSAP